VVRSRRELRRLAHGRGPLGRGEAFYGATTWACLGGDPDLALCGAGVSGSLTGRCKYLQPPSINRKDSRARSLLGRIMNVDEQLR
jgi:hypothetical protein